jgi:hypothetical protein
MIVLLLDGALAFGVGLGFPAGPPGLPGFIAIVISLDKCLVLF